MRFVWAKHVQLLVLLLFELLQKEADVKRSEIVVPVVFKRMKAKQKNIFEISTLIVSFAIFAFAPVSWSQSEGHDTFENTNTNTKQCQSIVSKTVSDSSYSLDAQAETLKNADGDSPKSSPENSKQNRIAEAARLAKFDFDWSSLSRHEQIQTFTEMQREYPNGLDESVSAEEFEKVKDLTLSFWRRNYSGRKALFFCDATPNQKNGVVTITKMQERVQSLTGIEPVFVRPTSYGFNFLIPLKAAQGTYYARATKKETKQIIREANPAFIHNLTPEGPVGLSAASLLAKQGLPFTTAFHTDWVDYYIPKIKNERVNEWLLHKAYGIFRWLHRTSERVIVPTQSMSDKMARYGFSRDRLIVAGHGVELDLFSPSYRDETLFQRTLEQKLARGEIVSSVRELKSPIMLFVGRIEKAKNLEAFLKMKSPGTKVLIGDGTQKAALEGQYRDAIFFGGMPREELPKYFASADLFVTPSLSETFGLTVLEASASGVFVLGFDAQGINNAMTSPTAGVLVPPVPNDVEQAARHLDDGYQKVMELKKKYPGPSEPRRHAEANSVESSLVRLLFSQVPIEEDQEKR